MGLFEGLGLKSIKAASEYLPGHEFSASLLSWRAHMALPPPNASSEINRSIHLG